MPLLLKEKKKGKKATMLYFWLVCLTAGALILLVLAVPGIAGTAAGTVFGGKNIGEWVSNVYNFSFGAIAIAAVMMIVIGGFFYVTSAGNTERASTGREMLVSAIIGLVLLLTAYFFLNLIAGRQFLDFGEGWIGQPGQLQTK